MKVASLAVYSYYAAIGKDGKRYNIADWLEIGLWEMQRAIENKFGIVTSTTTIYNRTKAKSTKGFKLNKFGYSKDKAELLAFANWVLFFPPEQRANFFVNESNIERFYKDNPIVDIELCFSLESVKTDVQYKKI